MVRDGPRSAVTEAADERLRLDAIGVVEVHTDINRDSLNYGVDDDTLPAIRGTYGFAMPTNRARCAEFPCTAGVGTELDHRARRWRTMNDRGPWAVTCRHVAGRPRRLAVLVRGSGVVVMAPPGEVVYLDTVETEQFSSILAAAVDGAATSAQHGAGRFEETGTASTVKQHADGDPSVTAGCVASPSYRGGSTIPMRGSAATRALRFGRARCLSGSQSFCVRCRQARIVRR